MSNSFIEWKPTTFFSSQTGVQVFINENKKLEVSCVERSLFSRIVDSIAHIFGTSSNYGIHLIPETAPIFLELSENFNKEDISQKILPQIRVFLDKQTTPITKDSYSAVLEKIAKKTNCLKEKIPFLSPPESEQIESPLINEKDVSTILTIENPSNSSSSELLEEIQSEDNAILNTRRLKNRAKLQVPPAKGFSVKKIFTATGLALFAGLGSYLLQSKTEDTNQPGPVCDAPRPALSAFAHKPLENVSHLTCFLKKDVDLPHPVCNSLLYSNPSVSQTTKPSEEGVPYIYLKNRQALIYAGFNPKITSHENKAILYNDGSLYTGEIDKEGNPTKGELYDRMGNVIYKGSWHNGKLSDGFGTVFLDDQSLFTGPLNQEAPWRKGIKTTLYGQEEYIIDGYGKLAVNNDQIFIGDLEKRQPGGYGELFSKDGTLIKEGIFKGNELIKEIRTIPLPNSEFFRGQIDEKGLPDGYGVVYSEKGLFIGKFDHGKLIGIRPEEKNSSMLLFSSYTSDIEFNQEEINNQKLYAKEKGYHYVEFFENPDLLETKKLSMTLPYASRFNDLRLLVLLNPQKFPEKFRKHLPQEFVYLSVHPENSLKTKDIVERYVPQVNSNHIYIPQNIFDSFGYFKNTLESRSTFFDAWFNRGNDSD